MLYLVRRSRRRSAFRMNLFNIGVEGQYRWRRTSRRLFAGAALPARHAQHPGRASSSPWWSARSGPASPASSRSTRGVSEVISTIMLNAIAGPLVGYLLTQASGSSSGKRHRAPTPIAEEQLDRRASRSSPDSADELYGLWPDRGRRRASASRCCSTGPASASTCAPPACRETAAVASGVNVKRMVVDLDAALRRRRRPGRHADAVRRRAQLRHRPFQAGLGFAGIAVALLGRNHPVGIAFGALLFAFLDEQANPLEHPGRRLAATSSRSPRASSCSPWSIAYEVVRRYRVALEQRAVARGRSTPSVRTQEVTRMSDARSRQTASPPRSGPRRTRAGAAALVWICSSCGALLSVAGPRGHRRRRDRLRRHAAAPRSSPPCPIRWPASAGSGPSARAWSTSASRA